MKTSLRLTIAACGLAVLNVLVTTGQAQDYTYHIYDGNVTITGYTGPGGDVTIPSAIDGLPVVSIGQVAFSACTSLTSVTIPDSVTSIGVYSFSGCISLTSVTIPDSVTRIEDGAFYGCTNLTSVMIPNSVTSIGDRAFSGCTSLTSVTLGGGVTNVTRWAFDGCTSLARLKLCLNQDGLPGYDFIEGFTSLGSLDLSSSQASAVRLPTTLAALRELRVASATLQSLGVPYQLGGVTNLDLRDMSRLDLLVIPESLAGSLRPSVETLRNQGVVVSTYDPLRSPLHYVSLACTNPIPPYTTWDTAANVIQDAVDAAKDGDTVLVTNGVYALGSREVSILDTNQEPPQVVSFGVSRVVVKNAIRLESVDGPQVTTIDGGGAVRCVYLGTNAVLSGFTLRGGHASSCGGGVWSIVPDGVITNCVLAENGVWAAFSAARGGGVCGGTLYDCLILNNSSTGGNSMLGFPGWGFGGGAFGCTLSNCTVMSNSAAGSVDRGGGGAANCVLRNCTLTTNQCDRGGGASGSTLYGCTVIGNGESFRSGGVDGSTLYNCALTGNTGYGADRSTLYNCTVTGNEFGVDGIAVNSIVWGNPNGNYDQATLDHCVTSPVPVDSLGNLDADPGFVDPANGDFRLRPDSPCIDAGTNLLGLTATRLDPNTGEQFVLSYAHDPTDILGNTRFIDGNGDGKVAWDIGAYEFKSFKPPRFSVAPQRTEEGWVLDISGAPKKWARLQRSADLKNWENIGSPVYMGEAGIGQIKDADTGPAVMFYRVAVEQ